MAQKNIFSLLEIVIDMELLHTGLHQHLKKNILGQFVVRNLENHLNYIDFF